VCISAWVTEVPPGDADDGGDYDGDADDDDDDYHDDDDDNDDDNDGDDHDGSDGDGDVAQCRALRISQCLRFNAWCTGFVVRGKTR